MKIFLVHASAGFGHKMIAESLSGAAHTERPTADIRIFDILDFTPGWFKFLYTKGYTYFISKLSWVWAVFFFITDSKFLKSLVDCGRFRNNRKLCKKFIDLLVAEQPDVIVSTHFLANEIISGMKEKQLIQSKVISMITDFGVHRFWLASHIDTFCVASQATKRILLGENIDEKKITVTGMPVRQQFLRPLERSAMVQKLGIQTDQFTVTILTGGIGIGPIYEIVTSLMNESMNIIVICGKNKTLYDQLVALNKKNIYPLGWIDYVEEAMTVSDVMVTKAGGSTIAECLLKELPMIYFSLIPGQEVTNARILSQEGAGFIITQPQKIYEKIIMFKNNPQQLSLVKERIKSLRFNDPNHNVIGLI